MSPSNPSRKRALPSWMKRTKSVKSSNVANSSSIGGFLDSNKDKNTSSASGENATNAEDRTGQKSMFVPRNTVLFVMSELELLETARLVLEEDEHSLPPQQQRENIETPNDEGDDVEEEEEEQQQQQQQKGKQLTSLKDIPAISDNMRNELKDQDTLNGKMAICLDSSHSKLKPTSKRRLYESPDNDDIPNKDAMDIEPSSVIGVNPTAGQSTSGLGSVPDFDNKEFITPSSNPDRDSMPNNKTLSSTITPTQKKRSKPNLTILDEIFF